MSLMVGTGIAGMTKDAGLIRLACAADPHDVILLERILTHPPGCVAVDGPHGASGADCRTDQRKRHLRTNKLQR